MSFLRKIKFFLRKLKTPLGLLVLSSLIHMTFRPVSSESNWLDYLHLLNTIGVAIYVGFLTAKQGEITSKMSFILGIFVLLISSIMGFGEIFFKYLMDIREINNEFSLVLQGYLLGILMLAPFLGFITMLTSIVVKKYKI